MKRNKFLVQIIISSILFFIIITFIITIYNSDKTTSIQEVSYPEKHSKDTIKNISAIRYYLLDEPFTDTLERIKNLKYMASRYTLIKEYGKAKEYASVVTNLAPKIKDSSSLGYICGLLGNIAQYEQDYQLALKYRKKEATYKQSITYSKISKTFLLLGDADSAKFYYLKEIYSPKGHELTDPIFYSNYYILKDVIDSAKHYNEKYFKITSASFHKEGSFMGAFIQYKEYLKYLLKKNDNECAINFAERVSLLEFTPNKNRLHYVYNQSNSRLEDLKYILCSLDSLYKLTNQHNKRIDLLKKSNSIIELINKGDKEVELNILRQRYQLEEQNRKLVEAKQEKKRGIILLLITICLTFLTSLIIIFYFRNKKKTNSNPNIASQKVDIKIAENNIKTEEASPPKTKTDQNYQELFAKIEEHFKKRKPYLSNDLNRKGIAIKLQTNEIYIQKAIMEATNLTVSDYINSFRIKYAHKLIAQNKITKIDDLATASGFSSRPSFQRAFIKHTGMSVKEFKESQSL